MSMLHNFPLLAALCAIVAAQIVKVPVYLITHRTWNVGLGFSTGGMPSSHSAAVTSLATAIGLKDGFDSSGFAIAAIVSAITMFDAAGIRRHAGMHASILNQWAKSVPGLLQEGNLWRELKELLGHRPSEVYAGACFGIVVSLLLYYAFAV
ncbi:divergent PAP2 family protein [Paenibacillus sp. MWE-103]|uniref:Divergent PAP2 family protein n=1 Tax=Paenibacillus artemisiicola TaxID=1172618 RepID=A0ABS3W4J2_9BACL|nr:divergent PAP2 family protein [Paenibacillus artemisiicola]MBO7743065.1 divergent PAP2 family protein [Paenibacillus artemisiicola]